MTFKTNDARRTMEGDKYVSPFYGDKSHAWQWLVSRQTLLVARIIPAERRSIYWKGVDRELGQEWLRQDRQELARVRQALRTRE